MRRPWIILLLFTLAACSGPSEKPSISFYLALERGDLNQVERHLAWDADLRAPLPNGLPPLHMVSAAGRVALARTLLKHGADPNGLDPNQKTPLYHALLNGRTQLAELLIRHKAKLDAQEMLWQLVQQETDDRDAVAFLQTHGADINQLHQGQTPLGEAIRRNNLHLTKLLIRAGADVNKADHSGATALELATQIGNEHIIRLLQHQGAQN